jgi:hypothetical protein
MHVIGKNMISWFYAYVEHIEMKTKTVNIIHFEIDFFCVSKLSIDLFFKLPVSRFLAINIEGKIGQLTVRRTSSFNMRQATCL